MKRLKFLSLLILGVCMSIQGFARINIVLKDSWNRVQKSVISNIPINIWLEDNEDLIVQFTENLGPIDICITTLDGNLLYRTTMNATSNSTNLIKLDNMENKIYVSNKDNLLQGLIDFVE